MWWCLVGGTRLVRCPDHQLPAEQQSTGKELSLLEAAEPYQQLREEGKRDPHERVMLMQLTRIRPRERERGISKDVPNSTLCIQLQAAMFGGEVTCSTGQLFPRLAQHGAEE